MGRALATAMSEPLTLVGQSSAFMTSMASYDGCLKKLRAIKSAQKRAIALDHTPKVAAATSVSSRIAK